MQVVLSAEATCICRTKDADSMLVETRLVFGAALSLAAETNVQHRGLSKMPLLVWCCCLSLRRAVAGMQAVLSEHSAEVVGVALHPTNKYFITASADKSWAFYDLESTLCMAQVLVWCLQL